MVLVNRMGVLRSCVSWPNVMDKLPAQTTGDQNDKGVK
jgi:hypothetical protein